MRRCKGCGHLWLPVVHFFCAMAFFKGQREGIAQGFQEARELYGKVVDKLGIRKKAEEVNKVK